MEHTFPPHPLQLVKFFRFLISKGVIQNTLSKYSLKLNEDQL